MKQQIEIHGNFNYLCYGVKIKQVYRVDNQLVAIAKVTDNKMESAPASQADICYLFMRQDRIMIENSADSELPVKLYLILPEGCEFNTNQTVTSIKNVDEIEELNDPENMPMLLKVEPDESRYRLFDRSAEEEHTGEFFNLQANH